VTLKAPLGDLAAHHDDARHSRIALAADSTCAAWWAEIRARGFATEREYRRRVLGEDIADENDPPRKEPDR